MLLRFHPLRLHSLLSRINPSVVVARKWDPCLQKWVNHRPALNLPSAWLDVSFSWDQVNGRRGGTHLVPPAPPTSPASTSPAPVVDVPSDREPDRQSNAITDVPVTYPHRMGLLKEAGNQYSRDSFYKKVMDALKAFKNFELADGFICQNLHDRTVWDAPDIRARARQLQESITDQAHSLLAGPSGSTKNTFLPARSTFSCLQWW